MLLVGTFAEFEFELAAVRACVSRIQPDRVLLGTVTRPPAEECAIAVPHDRLMELAATFSPQAEVLQEYHSPDSSQALSTSREDILGLLARRPCTIDAIARGLQMHKVEVLKYIESLVADGLIEPRAGGTEQVYGVRRPS